eukprot:TRINITY_DN2533_c2_g1_i1.p1 TRINITY_DN2533_c2_g1~~TRINITY_DN2533_c2_g1_i1.p1  ORF type:complete len:1447 (-),score=316.26 TRINITY_DN2533_c2_g1_i1:127-4467(-)
MNWNIDKKVVIWIVLVICLWSCGERRRWGSEGQSRAFSSLYLLGNIYLSGGGSGLVSNAMNSLQFIYQFVNNSVIMTFNVSKIPDAVRQIQNFELDYIVSQYVPGQYVYDSGLETFPAFTVALVLCYNLPGVTTFDSHLILTRDVIVRIYTGNITQWNDPAILQLNQNATFYSTLANTTNPILLITRSDYTASNLLLTSALTSFSPLFPYAAADYNWSSVSNISVSSIASVISYSQSTPFSLSYLDLSDAISSRIPYAWVVNKAGNLIDPNLAVSLSSPVQNQINNFDQHLVANLADTPGPQSYPLVGLAYIIAYTGAQYPPNTNCERVMALFNWVVWFETTSAVAAQLNRLGYGVLPPIVLKKLMDKVSRVRCIPPIDGSLGLPTNQKNYIANPTNTYYNNSYSNASAMYVITDENLLSTQVQALDTQVQVGSGGDSLQFIFGVWSKYWSDPGTVNEVISYTAETASPAKYNIFHGYTDFGLSDFYLSESEKQNWTNTDDFSWIPISGYGMVMMYNLPNRTSITFTMDVVVDILLGNITRWNDKRITDLNPQILSVLKTNQPFIKIVYRSDTGTGTVALVNILANYSSAFNEKLREVGWTDESSFVDWPAVWGKSSITYANSVPANGATAEIAGVNNNPLSIGYAGISGIYSRSVSTNSITVAKIVNSAGIALSPSYSTISSALTDTYGDPNSSLTSYVFNPRSNNSYPMTSSTFMIIPKYYQTFINSTTTTTSNSGSSFTTTNSKKRQNNNNSNRRIVGVGTCDRVKGFLDFIYWVITDSKAAAAAQVLYYGAVNNDRVVRNIVLELSTIECNNQPAFSRYACVAPDGSLCNNNGYCAPTNILSRRSYRYACDCDPGYEGRLCESQVTNDSTEGRRVLAIVLGVVLGTLFLLCCCCILLLIIFGYFIKRTGYDRYRRGRNWIVDYSQLEFGEVIGVGAHGTVYKGVYKGGPVAIKVLTQNEQQVKELSSDFIKEVQIMGDLRHPAVVLFMGASIRSPNLAIVMEYMALGSLHNLLHNEYVTNISQNKRLKIALQTAQGMQYLHSSGIIHRDLKSHNLLMDENWNVKISDFGLTKFKSRLEAKNEEDDKQLGTIYWTAPEVLDGGLYSEESDVYSFGIVLWEIATRQDPYSGMNPTTVAIGVVRDKLRPALPDLSQEDQNEDDENNNNNPNSNNGVNEIWRQHIVQCWSQNQDERPTFEDLANQFRLYHNESSSTFTLNMNSGNDLWAGVDNSNSNNNNDSNVTNNNDTSRERNRFIKHTGSKGDPSNGIRAPQGDVVIVFSDIVQASTLWEKCPQAMHHSTLVHNSILREQLIKVKGYEVGLMQMAGGEGSFCAAFSDVFLAVEWCVRIQEELLIADWPSELLSQEETREAFDENNKVVFRGLQVRNGINFGETVSGLDPLTRRIAYVGNTVSIAAKTTILAQGGQILMTHSVLEQLKTDKKTV